MTTTEAINQELADLRQKWNESQRLNSEMLKLLEAFLLFEPMPKSTYRLHRGNFENWVKSAQKTILLAKAAAIRDGVGAQEENTL